jgi:hypothetical protein
VKVGFKMVKASNKVRASVLVATFGLFLATTSFATTSNAATIKTGVTCKKDGLKGKAGSKRYVCGKNPYVTPTKLTWMLSQCSVELENFNMLKDGEKEALDLATTLGFNFKTLTELAATLDGQDKKEVDEMIQNIANTDKALRNNLCKKGR